jgi:hypothetical protein
MTADVNMAILLLSGIPAGGKSTLGKYFAANHGFLYFDMEHPETWPQPGLHQVWERSRHEFVVRLNQLSHRVVLDWGFRPCCLPLVLELKSCGVRLVWFRGNVETAQRHFRNRNRRLGKPANFGMEAFAIQTRAIKAAGLPGKHGFKVIQAFDSKGSVRALKHPERLIKAILSQ